MESADPAGSAQRAERLLAPVLPRARQPEEAELSSVAAPDGTAVFFCRTGADATAGSADFAPTGDAARGDGLVDRDRPRLAHRVDRRLRRDRAVLPRRCSACDATETDRVRRAVRADPQPGRHRRRPAASGSRSTPRRCAAATGRRPIPSPQHVAFTTDDAIASAEAMRALGAPVLKIPDNYYDDLDARLALPPELLAAMREHSILYDRDEHGEYLHFFTEMLGSRVFFEVVQRIGGYTGYGDPNSAPVRMAAHRERRLITLRDDRATRRPAPRLLAGPPDRAEPVPAGTGRRRRRRRLPLRRPAPDPGHAAGAALSARHRPGPDAHDQGAPRRDRHRGPRHRARPDQPERRPARLPALPRGRRRTRRAPRHHPASRPRPRPQDRPVRAAV